MRQRFAVMFCQTSMKKNLFILFLFIFLNGCVKQSEKKLFEVELVTVSQFDCRIPVIRFQDTTGMKLVCGFSSLTAMTREIPVTLRMQGKQFFVSIKPAPDAVLCTHFGPAPPPLLVIDYLKEKR